MSKKEQDDVTLDAEKDEKASVEDSNEETTTDIDKNEETSEDKTEDDSDKSEDSDDTDEEAKPNSTLLFVEIIAVVAIVIFIVFAIVRNGAGSASGNSASSNVSGNASVSNQQVVIDNSVLFENVPAIPDVVSANTLTLEECEARVADGTMIMLTTSDGTNVYVNNYTDSAYFNENATYSQDDVDKAIMNEVLAGYAESVSTNRTVAQMNDVVDIDFVGKKDGVAFENGSASAQQLMLGSGSYIPGFEEGIVGMEVGTSKDVTVTFPEEYSNSPDLAGQEVVFTISLNAIIAETTYPELSDEIVSSTFTDMTTVSECQAYYQDAMLKDSIWTFIGTDFYVSAVPDETVLAYYNSTMTYYDYLSKNYQMSITDLLNMYGSSVDTLKIDVMTTSVSSAQYSVLYSAIAEANGLSVSDEDISSLAAEYGYTDVQAFFTDYGEETIRDYILQSKVMDYLLTVHE